MPGSATLAVEITHVSRHGFWLLVDAEELLVPFADFPWFRQATASPDQRRAFDWSVRPHLTAQVGELRAGGSNVETIFPDCNLSRHSAPV